MAIFNADGLSTAPVSTVLDAGLYAVTILRAEGVTSQAKGTPGIEIEGIITSESPQQNGTYARGKHVFGTIWLSASGAGREIGLSRLARLCRAAEVEQTDNLDLAEFVNRNVVVRLKQEQYNGEPRAQIADFIKPSV